MGNATSKPALAQQQTLPVIRLLLVEDNSSDAFIVSNLLGEITNADCRMRHVKTQTEALLAIAKQPFDVCLLDLTLSDANGFSALVDIQEKTSDMPILILTGNNDMDLAKDAVAHGAQDYLLKDEIDTSMLERAIDYAIERKRMEKALFARANHDGLTGLVNRSMFESRLEIALERAERMDVGVAVLFIDLDHFKPINDEYGHNAGDEVLKTVANRIRAALRPYDTSARFGGDEFAVLLEGISNPRDLANIAQKILNVITVPIPYQGKELTVNGSIGVVFTQTKMASNEVLQHADAAMYHAKKREGNSYHFYAPEMHDHAQARLKLEDDLRVALAAEEFQLYYQPYVIPGSQKIAGVETLLRWENPERGLLSPGQFLAVAESEKLMPAISAWIGTQLRHDIAMWNSQSLPPLEITVNLSPSQIEVPGPIEWLAPLAQEDFLGDHRLAIDIPEEMLISLNKEQHKTLMELHELGIILHLDHFGRGPLLLQPLVSLPFASIKLDLSLVQGMVDEMEGDVLVNAAIALAHHMGLQVRAVGAEIPWQEKALIECKCDVMQGFLIAQPMIATALVEWVEQQKQ